jgi:hypothetical protein
MDAVADDGSDEACSMDEEESDEDDVHDGMPVQGSATGDVDPEPSTPIDTHAQSSTPINSQSPQEPSTATAKPSTAINNEPSTATAKPSTAINREPRRTQLPKATVVAKSVKMPVKVADKPDM